MRVYECVCVRVCVRVFGLSGGHDCRGIGRAFVTDTNTFQVDLINRGEALIWTSVVFEKTTDYSPWAIMSGEWKSTFYSIPLVEGRLTEESDSTILFKSNHTGEIFALAVDYYSGSLYHTGVYDSSSSIGIIDLNVS